MNIGALEWVLKQLDTFQEHPVESPNNEDSDEVIKRSVEAIQKGNGCGYIKPIEQPVEIEEEIEKCLDGFVATPTRDYFRNAIKHFYSLSQQSKPKVRFPHEKDIVDKVFGAGNLDGWEYDEAKALVALVKEELLKDFKEQPVCDGLEEEITSYIKKHYHIRNDETLERGNDALTTYDFAEIARHFYEIGWIHLWETECKGKKEVCVELKDEIERWLKEGAITDTRYDDFDERDIRTTARHFAQWQKEQMLKEAVEVDTSMAEYNDADFKSYLWNILMMMDAINGDKVKLVIIKED